MSEPTRSPTLRFEAVGQFAALQSAFEREAVIYGREHAAFLFASPVLGGDLRVVEVTELAPADFVKQSSEYAELREHVLQGMIVRAHQTGTALIEAHSHPFARGPQIRFSRIDCEGLEQVGPHVSWRLPGRPYVALVFGRDAFDSLYWEGSGQAPRGSFDILASGKLLRASRSSIRSWRNNHGQVRKAT